jgi:hypothetical protein
MEDNELYEVLNSFKEAIDMIIARQKELDEMYEEGHNQMDDRIHKLESILYDEILGPAKEMLDKDADDKAFGEFHDKYGEQFAPLSGFTKSIEGDDFDVERQAYDDYNGIEGDKPDEDAYVAKLVENLKGQLDAIIEQAKNSGIDMSNKTVEIEKNGNEPATVEVEDASTQDKEEEAGHGEEASDDIEISEDATEDDQEELKQLMKEYEKEAALMKK